MSVSMAAMSRGRGMDFLSFAMSESINATGGVYCKASHSRAKRVGNFDEEGGV